MELHDAFVFHNSRIGFHFGMQINLNKNTEMEVALQSVSEAISV
jgi:hypothetical protein